MEKDYLEDWDEFEEFEDGFEESDSEETKEIPDYEYEDDGYEESEYEDDGYEESEYEDDEYEDAEYEDDDFEYDSLPDYLEASSFAERHPDGADTTYVGADFAPDEDEPRRRHPERVRLTPEERQEKKRKRKQQVRIMKILIAIGIVIALVGAGIGIHAIVKHFGGEQGETPSNVSQEEPAAEEADLAEAAVSDNDITEDTPSLMTVNPVSDNSVSEDSVSENEGEPDEADAAAYYAVGGMDDAPSMSSPEFTSEYGIMANTSKREVIAQKRGNERMIPASMTKVLTLLVAAEHVTDLDDTFTITLEVTDYSFKNDCSAAGFARDEVVTVKDLLYGTILPSGGDAAYALSCYVAGSHEAFVEMMNEKLAQLGLADTTHFVNCVGIYDDDHYSTPYDMAVIMEAAMDNELCRQVLTTRTYKTSQTPQHPDGIPLSNLFNRRIEDYDIKGELLGAKTGFVNESGNCAVSCYKGSDGDEYVCVTAGAKGAWRCIYDHVAAYQIYAAGNTEYTKERDLTKVEGAP